MRKSQLRQASVLPSNGVSIFHNSRRGRLPGGTAVGEKEACGGQRGPETQRIPHSEGREARHLRDEEAEPCEMRLFEFSSLPRGLPVFGNSWPHWDNGVWRVFRFPLLAFFVFFSSPSTLVR